MRAHIIMQAITVCTSFTTKQYLHVITMFRQGLDKILPFYVNISFLSLTRCIDY